MREPNFWYPFQFSQQPIEVFFSMLRVGMLKFWTRAFLFAAQHQTRNVRTLRQFLCYLNCHLCREKYSNDSWLTSFELLNDWSGAAVRHTNKKNCHRKFFPGPVKLRNSIYLWSEKLKLFWVTSERMAQGKEWNRTILFVPLNVKICCFCKVIHPSNSFVETEAKLSSNKCWTIEPEMKLQDLAFWE